MIHCQREAGSVISMNTNKFTDILRKCLTIPVMWGMSRMSIYLNWFIHIDLREAAWIKLNLYVVIAEEKYMKSFWNRWISRRSENVNLNVVHAL